MRIAEMPIASLGLHGEVPIAFLVERVLDVTLVEEGLGGRSHVREGHRGAWLKDYDTVKGEGPTRWARRFDVTNWGLTSAHEAGRRLGGAVVAFKTAGISMLAVQLGTMSSEGGLQCVVSRSDTLSRRSARGSALEEHRNEKSR